MTTSTHGDWEQWSAEWRERHDPEAEVARLLALTAGARRSFAAIRGLSLAVAVVACAIVAAALYHAANVMELALGFVVALGILTGWLLDSDSRRNAYEHADAPLEQYLQLRQALCARRLRFARLLGTVAVLDLVFLLPWWAGGFKVHGYGIHAMQILTMWLPLGMIVAAVVVAARVRATARRELAAIAGLTS